MILRPYGDRAVLVEPEPEIAILALREAALGLPGVVEVVPGARTLLIEFDPTRLSAERLGDLLRKLRPSASSADHTHPVEIRVTYDGEDLSAVAAETGLSRDEVVRRHAAPTYVVAFCGFVPGFAYLAGLDPALRLSRLADPRTRVPAGAVAIADEFSGVYPRPSPGGWRLLGHTRATLWMPDRDPPALLSPGTVVRFIPA